MSTPGSDPFAVGPPPARPPAPPGPPEPPTPAERASSARMVIVGVAALGTAVLAPPVGAVLGVLTLVLAARAGRASTGLRAVMVLVGGAAVVVGTAATVGALLLRTEITQYRDCVQGANTRVAQQSCQDALDAALRERVGIAP